MIHRLIHLSNIREVDEIGRKKLLSNINLDDLGIYQEKNCSQINVNHALQLIGYGNGPTGEQYWLAKNSWGRFLNA